MKKDVTVITRKAFYQIKNELITLEKRLAVTKQRVMELNNILDKVKPEPLVKDKTHSQ